jgi:hypothetical protein
VVLDVLNYWRKNGLADHKIGAYTSMSLTSHTEIMQAIWYFGGAYLGLNLPISAQTQKIWSVPKTGTSGDGSPGSWGGHAVPIVAYNAIGPICISWGEKIQMTWAFYDVYCEEAYACFSQDIVGPDNKSPEGFDSTQLLTDLQLIASK